MSYPRKYPTTDGTALAPTDWNTMVDRVNGYLPEGVFVGPYNFVISTIEIEGIPYYYANNAFQLIYGGPSNKGSKDGTNGALIIQTCINTGLPTFITPGTYICEQLTFPSNMCLIGSGVQNTIIKTADDVDTYSIITSGTASNILLRDLTFDGNKTNNITDSVHLFLEDSKIEHCNFQNFYGNGLEVRDGSTNNLIANCVFKGCTGDGLYIAGIENKIRNNQSYQNGDCGFVITVWGDTNEFDSENTEVTGNTAYLNYNVGFALVSNIRAIVIGNKAYNNGLGGTSNPGASGFYFLDDNGRGSYDCVFAGNIAYDDQTPKTQTFGAYVGNPTAPYYTTNMIVTENNLKNNKLGSLAISGANHTITSNQLDDLTSDITDSIVKDNIGFATENIGLLVGNGDEQIIEHGLGGVPTHVTLCDYNGIDRADAYQSTGADETNIYVTAVSGKTYIWETKIKY